MKTIAIALALLAVPAPTLAQTTPPAQRLLQIQEMSGSICSRAWEETQRGADPGQWVRMKGDQLGLNGGEKIVLLLFCASWIDGYRDAKRGD